MSVRYNTVELCTALKPWLMLHVLAKGEAAVHLDADVRVYAPLAGLTELLREHPLRAHPPSARTAAGRRARAELSVDAARRRVQHRADRSRSRDGRPRSCCGGGAIAREPSPASNPSEGLSTTSAGPAWSPAWSSGSASGATPAPTSATGVWRRARSDPMPGQVMIGGQPLRCFHFTGFDPSQPERLSRYDNRTRLESQPVLAELCEDFAERLAAHDHEASSRWPYGFAATASGAALDSRLRALWDRAAGEGAAARHALHAGRRERISGLAGRGRAGRRPAAVSLPRCPAPNERRGARALPGCRRVRPRGLSGMGRRAGAAPSRRVCSAC